MNDNGERDRLCKTLNKFGDAYLSVEVEGSVEDMHRDAHRIADLLEADAAELAARNSWLAECYRQSGADPSGGMKGDVNEDWRLAQEAVVEVTRLRKDYDEACEEVYQLSQKIAAASQHECTIVHSEDPSAPAYLALGAVKVTRERCE